ncbi:helix-turn-helix transcriptional regulator [Scardovia wiggsiae]|uniref:helix-turn-helix transcriptional regulator n=1 Tax=Scardovia wiggsiae TaxID=230143 RepID=UPI00374F248A
MSLNVRNLLIEHKIKQVTLAKALNMHPQTLSNKLNGTQSFSLQDAMQIAKYFQVSTDKILELPMV